MHRKDEKRFHSRQILLVICCLLGGVALAVSSLMVKSVTIDEFQGMPHGLARLVTGRELVISGIPPLSEVLPGLIAWAHGARLPLNALENCVTSWDIGWLFQQHNIARYHSLFVWARILSVLCYLAGGLLVFSLSSHLYGNWGAVFSLCLFMFSPTILAHSRLATSDIYFLLFYLLWLWALQHHYNKGGQIYLILVGVSLGLACLSKLTGLLLFLLTPFALWFLSSESVGREEKAAPIGNHRIMMKVLREVIICLLCGVIVIHCGYPSALTLLPAGDFTFHSPLLRLIFRSLPSFLPIPLPSSFIETVDFQLSDKGYPAYCMGTFKQSGFLYYYLVALGVKTPLVVLFCWLLALVRLNFKRYETFMLGSGAFLLLFFSIAGHKNIGVRYILFFYATMAILSGRIVASLPEKQAPFCITFHLNGVSFFPKLLKSVAICSGMVLLFISLNHWPHYLPYFNAAVGGPENGHEYLLDSNIDWGQDLITLKNFMVKNKIERVALAYAGRVNPKAYGIKFTPLTAQITEPYVVISANLLWGRLYFVNGTSYIPDNPNQFAVFRKRKPLAVLGWTLYIFRTRREVKGN